MASLLPFKVVAYLEALHDWVTDVISRLLRLFMRTCADSRGPSNPDQTLQAFWTFLGAGVLLTAEDLAKKYENFSAEDSAEVRE